MKPARFAAKIRVFAEAGIPQIAASVSAEFAMEAVTGVVRAMPVDTGHARANVQAVFFGPASARELDEFDKNGGPTIARARAALANVRPFQNIHVTCPVPYAYRLEHGWSKQAPYGMFRLTLAWLRNRAKSIGARGADAALSQMDIDGLLR